MTNLAPYTVEPLPQTLRVNLGYDLAGFYALVVPDPRKGPAFRDFYLVHDETGRTMHMFGVEVQDDSMAAELAAFAAPQEIDTLLEEVTP